MILKKLKYLRVSGIILIFNFLLIHSSLAQQIFREKFDYKLNVSNPQVYKEAKEGNSYYFMSIGYYINANNIMYKKTKDLTYLNSNKTILNAIMKAGSSNSKGKKWEWKARFNDKKKFSAVDDKEIPLYEGYLFRYVVEYIYIIQQSNLKGFNNTNLISFVEENFDKWILRSKQNYNDYSMIHRERLHMGAQWASVAMYLSKILKNDKYLKIYNEFNNQLRESLVVKRINSNSCYIWNSTYNSQFTSSLKKRSLLFESEIQDVSHGNHVVQFIVDSYLIGMGGWTKSDLLRLANTVKYLQWNSQSKSFSDNVDGTNSKNSEMVNTGWKQTDGWMSLMSFDPKLKDIYSAFYNKQINKNRIDKSSLALQFYAKMF